MYLYNMGLTDKVKKWIFVLRFERPLRRIRGALGTACKKTGILYGRFVNDGFVFNDLRHIFNSNMSKAGVPESVIMEITGHATREMFDRYSTIDVKDTEQVIHHWLDG